MQPLYDTSLRDATVCLLAQCSCRQALFIYRPVSIETTNVSLSFLGIKRSRDWVSFQSLGVAYKPILNSWGLRLFCRICIGWNFRLVRTKVVHQCEQWGQCSQQRETSPASWTSVTTFPVCMQRPSGLSCLCSHGSSAYRQDPSIW